jgi:peptide/nickel transport system ATP-binding protein
MNQKVLEIQNLSVVFDTPRGKICALRNLSLSIGQGEIVVVAGESGCGKSVLCKTIMGLLPAPAHVTGGSIKLDGRELIGLSEKEYCGLRGGEAAMVFQDPMTSLDPTYTIGRQIVEAIQVHEKSDAPAARMKAIQLMEDVGIDHAVERFDDYPWMLSGGMRQRCVLAMALAQDTKLLIADEPTTALDEEVKNEILNLLLRLRKERGLSILFITHDLSAARIVADRLAVMYAGKIIEEGDCREVLSNPVHPYTWGLLHALPEYAEEGKLRVIPGSPPNIPEDFKGDAFAERNEYALGIDYIQEPPFFEISENHRAATWLADQRAPEVVFGRSSAKAGEGTSEDNERICTSRKDEELPLLRVEHLSHYFKLGRKSYLTVAEDVSFEIGRGEILGLVGRSGSGKTTLARCILGMYKPYGGKIIYDGIDITDRRHLGANRSEMAQIKKKLAREIQFISQDSGAALDGKMTVRQLIAEPLQIQKVFQSRSEMDEYIMSLMREVNVDENMIDRFPHELSGGQRQRVSIARAYGMNPKLLICDEPLASLDVSIQAQIVELFLKLQRKHGTSMLFIAHDLSMVDFISDRTVVLEKGRLV